MKHAAKMLAVVLVLFTLCSCYFVKQEPPISDSGEVSKEMVDEVKNVFSSVPKGTFLTFHSRDGFMLVSPDLKTEMNPTENIEKIMSMSKKGCSCTLSNDCSKLLLQYFVIRKGTPESIMHQYQMIFDSNGTVLFSNEYATEYQEPRDNDLFSRPHDYFLYTDDLRYITYSYDDKSYLFDTVRKRESNTYATKFAEGIDSNYIYYSGNEVYNINTRKLISIGDCSYVYEIKNDIALIRYSKETLVDGKPTYVTKYYNLDLKTNKRTEVDKSKIDTRHNLNISPDGTYSAEVYDRSDFKNPLPDHAAEIGIHITDLKTKKEQVYQGEYFSDLRWVEKK